MFNNMLGSCSINFGMKFKYCWDSLNKCFFSGILMKQCLTNLHQGLSESKKNQWRIKVTHFHFLRDLKCNCCSILKVLTIRSLGCWSKICFCLLIKDYRCFHPEKVEHKWLMSILKCCLFCFLSLPFLVCDPMIHLRYTLLCQCTTCKMKDLSPVS